MPTCPAPFDSESLEGKAAAKRALLEAFGFTITDDLLARPVVGMVSRMVDQKGLDLIEAAARELPTTNATFVIVGTGEPRYQNMWTSLSRSHPERIRVFIGFDERRAHLVEGGADIFLMPSRFEPCGLNQMYSLRYGTVPVVRAGGRAGRYGAPLQPEKRAGKRLSVFRLPPGGDDAGARRRAGGVPEQEDLDTAAKERDARRFLVGPLRRRICQNVPRT
jgi:starch synthase